MRIIVNLVLLHFLPLFLSGAVLRAGDGGVVFFTALSGNPATLQDGLYRQNGPVSLLRRLVPVIRYKKDVFFPAAHPDLRKRELAGPHWAESGMRCTVPEDIPGLSLAVTALAPGKGRVLLQLVLSNGSSEPVELAAGFLYRAGEGLRRLDDGERPGVVRYRKNDRVALGLLFHSGEKIGTVGAGQKSPFPDDAGAGSAGLAGWYSRLEIPPGKEHTVLLLLATGGDAATGVVLPDGTPDPGTLRREAGLFWERWLGNTAFPHAAAAAGHAHRHALVMLKGRLLHGVHPEQSVPDKTVLESGFAFLENGMYAESAAILKGMTAAWREPRLYPEDPELKSGYVSLLFSHFVRGGQFQGSLILAGRFLEQLALLPVTADRITSVRAGALAAAFTDGSILMGYARQKLRQEEYSTLAKKWMALLKDFFVDREGRLALPSSRVALPVEGRFLAALHQGYLGRFLALALPRADAFAPGYGALAMAAWTAGYPCLGRIHLRHAPAAARARAAAAAATLGAARMQEPFPARLLRLLQEELLVLARISPAIPNTFPYQNARSLLSAPGGSVEEREGQLLRLAAICERLRVQALQSEHEFARRLLVQDSLIRLEGIIAGMLRNRFRLTPDCASPGVVSFGGAPDAFLDTLRVETTASAGFIPVIRREGGGARFFHSLRYGGGRLADGGGGVRFLFRARYRGVDFVCRHALALRLAAPFHLQMLPPAGEAGFRVLLANPGPVAWDDVRAVLSRGLLPDAPPARLEPGEARSLLIRPDASLAHGDYPGMFTVRVGSHSYATNLVFRHALTFPLTNVRWRAGDVHYWKNPEYDDSAWSRPDGDLPAVIAWARVPFRLPEVGPRDRLVLVLDPQAARGGVWCNMSGLSGQDGVFEIPPQLLLPGRGNLLVLRFAGPLAGIRPVLYLYRNVVKE